ncbi:hypothetical protein [Variovorax paradoxus]|uniref:hypothetical protein n=1 Tax=Variovorax paradoxus TaxID=34073 RepID=UPI003ECE2914
MIQDRTRTGGHSEFATEADFVDRFVGKLAKGRTAFGRVQITTEWDHRAGFVDVLARNRRKGLVAFEAKLDNWKRAFHQAYRSTAYANKSYVIVPEHVASRAMRDREEFELRGVGLCSFDGSAVQVLIEAAEQDVLLRWLREQAHEHFNMLSDERRTGPKRSRCRPLQEARV